MPVVAVVDGVKSYFYVEDHPPAHFHALFAEHEAKIEIATLTVIKGRLPRAKLAKVPALASTRQSALSDAWAEAQSKRKLGRIG